MTILSDELAQDPEARGYAGMTAAQALSDLSEPRYSKTGLLPIGTVIAMLYQSGTFSAIWAAYAQGDAMARAALDKIRVMKELGIENIDFGQPSAIADMKQGGIPDSDIDALVALATKRASRLDMLGITASEGEIIEARK